MPRRALRSRTAAVVEGRRVARETALSLGAQVRAGRRRRGWTQRQLAQRVGLTASRIGQIERGQGRRLTRPLVRARSFPGHQAQSRIWSGSLGGADRCRPPRHPGARPATWPQHRAHADLRTADSAGRSCPLSRRRPARRSPARAHAQRVLEHVRQHQCGGPEHQAEGGRNGESGSCHRGRQRALSGGGLLDRSRYQTEPRTPGTLPRNLRHHFQRIVGSLGSRIVRHRRSTTGGTWTRLVRPRRHPTLGLAQSHRLTPGRLAPTTQLMSARHLMSGARSRRSARGPERRDSVPRTPPQSATGPR
jgi:DNA-binding XRE family transcriptional regulator